MRQVDAPYPANHYVKFPSGMTLEELNRKYPSCSTCHYREMRQGATKGKKRAGEITWCQRHNRPIQYHTHVDDCGKQWVLNDIPCKEYTYEYRPALLFGKPVQ